MRRLIRTLLISLASVMFCVGMATITQADTVTLPNLDAGNYHLLGLHTSSNKNYIAGSTNPVTNPTNNNYFVFNLAGLSGTVTGAQLRLYTYTITGPGTYRLFDVSTPVSELSAQQTNRPDIFADLGTGVSYGSIAIDATNSDAIITINFNAAAIAAIQNNGGLFAVGGLFDTVPDTYAFGFSNGGVDPRNQLIVQTNTAVPEPATMLLLGAGLAGVALKRRRRC